ncbi:hypothetical protein [Beijerinckia sp. L45]|uniref:hypothetical protein n=1 Tax=Beijerinckia sp. L45 TaxID=1641855 RepID=UPI00131AE2B2|nr:hypothetical protein [Beijerinckia sp. L45]
MRVSSIFNIPLTSTTVQRHIPRAGAEAIGDDGNTAAPETAPESVGAFITPQTLVSFTGATGAISLLWSALKTLALIPDGWNCYIGLLLSFVVGRLIYYINITGSNTTMSRRDKIIGFVIAVLNIFVLFNATKSILNA